LILTPISMLVAIAASAATTRTADSDALRIRCVEGRTASVFAGACHYGAERTTAGREALIAWHVESGSHAGVDLAGVDLAIVILGEDNLAEPRAARRSILYVSDRATPEQRGAAEALVHVRLGSAPGRWMEVATVPLVAAFDGDRDRVDAGSLFELRGELLADRACCKMSQAVWYQPLAPIERPIVGRNEVFRYADERLGVVWERHDENTAFAGTLGILAAAVFDRMEEAGADRE
jgi:hypothetical protein